MVSELASYIQRQLQAGYSIESVRTMLYQSGYTPFQVNQALQEIYAKPENKVKQFFAKFDMKEISIISGVLVAAIIGVFFLVSFLASGQPPQLLDVELSLIDKQAKPGEEFNFRIDLFSLGKDARFDVELEHQLLDIQGLQKNKEIETLAIETRMSKTSSITIPQNAEPGIYQLKSTARYNGLQATALIQFEVVGDEPITQPLPEPKEEPEPVIEEEQVEELIIEPKEEPEPITETTTIESRIRQIGQVSKQQVSAGLTECATLEAVFEKDACFEQVADSSNDVKACRRIQDKETRDRCITTYVLSASDFSVCDEIQTDSLRFSCLDLEKALG